MPVVLTFDAVGVGQQKLYNLKRIKMRSTSKLTVEMTDRIDTIVLV
jgi:hypothetical protein